MKNKSLFLTLLITLGFQLSAAEDGKLPDVTTEIDTQEVKVRDKFVQDGEPMQPKKLPSETTVDENNADHFSPSWIKHLTPIMLKIRSPNLTPPKDRLFQAFPSGRFAYLELTEDMIERLVDPNTEALIGLTVSQVIPSSADIWPLQGHGNFVPAKKAGGSGGKATPEEHWAVKVGPAVRIVADWDRDGEANPELKKDHVEKKNEDFKFLDKTGALVLVNCNKSERENPGEKGADTARDNDDLSINGEHDLPDLSPLTLCLLRDLLDDEEVWLVYEPIYTNKETKPKILTVLDKEWPEENQVLVGGPKEPEKEIRLDTTYNDGKVAGIFVSRKKIVVKDRVFCEALSFSETARLHLEVRKGSKVIERDSILLRTCPWLANNNTKALYNGYVTNSESYQWNQGHGATLLLRGGNGEFVQDSAEWGFQVRPQTKGESRKFITALRLYPENVEDQHPATMVSREIGAYGYAEGEDAHYEKSANDGGGNVECLPVSSGFPYGRIVAGDNLSKTLQAFLDKQSVQTIGDGSAKSVGIVLVPITVQNLAHVDEAICVLPNGVVAFFDCEAGLKLLKASPNNRYNVAVKTYANAGTIIDNYGDLYKYLTKGDKGKQLKQMTDQIAASKGFQAAIKNAGYKTCGLPGLYLMTSDTTNGDKQRPFPSSPVNFQPINQSLVVMSEPRKETVPGKNEREITSRFQDAWGKELTKQNCTCEWEFLTKAWRKQGEVHCSSNAIRIPFSAK